MRMGGAEKIALNFIPILQKYYEVTVVLNKKEGELLNCIPDGVEVAEDRLLAFGEVVKSDLKHFRIGKLLRDFVYYLKVKLGKNSDRNYRYLVSRTPPMDRHFDVAIAYVANVSTQIFSALDRTNAEKKIAWIHGETTELVDVELYNGCYSKFDKIYCVSGVSKEHFVKKFPSLREKCDIYYNPINREQILQRAEHTPEVAFDGSYINILSVGRITPEKGYDMVPEITRTLLDRGHTVRFYLIGDGDSVPLVRENMAKFGVEDSVILLGTKANPYPYMRNCDVYVQPSYEEGYSTTICEAAILGCAIVGTTSSGGIREQVEDGVSAILAEPSPEALSDKIESLIVSEDMRINLGVKAKQISFSQKATLSFFAE